MKRLFVCTTRFGLTLIEMLVGLAVLGVVVAAAIPSLTDLIERRRVVAAAGEIASIFAYAKSEANVAADPMSLHMEPVPSSIREYSSCLRLGHAALIGGCACDLPPSEPCSTVGTGAVLREFVIPRSQSVTFARTAESSFVRRSNVLGFNRNNRFTGTHNVQIDVKGSRTGATLRVEYNNAGRVSTCSPDGSVGGFPTCPPPPSPPATGAP